MEFDYLFTANSPEKRLHNMIYCPINWSKQIQETHMAYSAGTHYTLQNLNEKQHTWLYRQIVIFFEAMYVVFHSNFAAYIVCQAISRVSFLDLFGPINWWGNKSYCVITSLANSFPRRFQYSKLSVFNLINFLADESSVPFSYLQSPNRNTQSYLKSHQLTGVGLILFRLHWYKK